jgi:hypothetical protein
MILNCIIPDSWVLKSARKALEDRAKYDAPLGPEILITPNKKTDRRDENGHWSTLPTANSFSNLSSGGRVWVRPSRWGNASVETKQMLALARRLGLQCSTAKIRIRSGERSLIKRAGIVVRLRDACAFLLVHRPELLEQRRAAIYDNDDH